MRRRYGAARIPAGYLSYWAQAQQWELAVWIDMDKPGDRFEQHRRWFQDYLPLKGLRLGHVVELGCGPYTQSIPMIKAVGHGTLSSLTLVDPLLDMYLQKVKDVPYRDESRTMFDRPTVLVRADAESAGDILQPVDTVVMMNVIEHCTNGPRILNTLWKLLKPGGLLVFHEYDYSDSGFIWDKGHPIKLKAATYNLLLQHFEVIFRRDFDHEGDYSHTMGVYFIGRKPAATL
jgi:SAM-dependent methyltransferase